MKPIIIVAFCCFTAMGQMCPIRPIEQPPVTGSPMVQVCTCNGISCGWSWIASYPTAAPATGIIGTLANGVRTSQDIQQQQAQINNQQLQNQILQQQLEQQKLQRQTIQRQAAMQQVFLVAPNSTESNKQAQLRHPDFSALLAQVGGMTIPDQMTEFLRSSRVSGEVIYWLASNQTEAARIIALPAAEMILAIHAVEQSLLTGPDPNAMATLKKQQEAEKKAEKKKAIIQGLFGPGK